MGLSFPGLLVCSHGVSGLCRSSLDPRCSGILMVPIGGCFTSLTDLGVDGVVTLAALLTWGDGERGVVRGFEQIPLFH